MSGSNRGEEDRNESTRKEKKKKVHEDNSPIGVKKLARGRKKKKNLTGGVLEGKKGGGSIRSERGKGEGAIPPSRKGGGKVRKGGESRKGRKRISSSQEKSLWERSQKTFWSEQRFVQGEGRE